jgi:DNA primase large subunit
MRRLHARYPFLEASREAVQEAEVDLADLIRERGPPVERGVERVERALLAGTVAPESRWGTRAELLSYPVARVLVSLLSTPGVVEKYAAAEAALAHRRFTEDFDADARLRSTDRERLSLDALLADFGLAAAVQPTGDGGFRIDATDYLRFASGLEDDRWRLVSRELHDGRLPVARTELYTLLREAVRRRVADGLPLSVPEGVADALSDEVGTLREAIADVDADLSGPPGAVVPELFPPCVRALLDRVGGGAALPPDARLALVAFLSGLDLDADGLLEFCDADDLDTAESLRYQFERLADERGPAFPIPSCGTMVARGLCVNRDEVCEEIAHPVAYYGTRLDRADRPDAKTDTDRRRS